MSVNIIAAMALVHFIADFVLQSSWMAQNKSKDLLALTAHVAVYGLCLSIFAGALTLLGLAQWAPMAAFVVVNTLLHFAVDSITSFYSAGLWSEKRWHDFFVLVGFDQLLHFVILIYTLNSAIGVT